MNIPDAKRIKPDEEGKSDFFSWNLYEFVRKNPDLCRIYQSNWNRCSGHEGGLKHGDIMIGLMREDGWFSGSFVQRSSDQYEGEPCDYHPRHFQTAKWKDITDSFWKRYLRIGVCAMGNYRHYWIEESETRRKCKYCKTKQERHTEMVPEHTWKRAV